MGFGASDIEREAQAYRRNYGQNLPNITQWGRDWMHQGRGQLDTVNAEIRNYLANMPNDTYTVNMQNYLQDVMSGKIKAATGQFHGADVERANFTGLDMRGKTVAAQFGQQLGGLALQQRNMQTVADKLASTSNSPFAQMNMKAMEDIALQNSQSQQQLRNQLAAQGLGSTSGAGAAALAALSFNNNKTYADAVRQNAVQGAQLQQQGLQAAGQLYGQLGSLDLQRAQTAAQLDLSGYQADLQNAQRMDAMNQFNAAAQNAANIHNSQLQTNVSLQNAAAHNQLLNTGMQTSLQLQQQRQNQAAQLYALLSGNANAVMGAGQNVWNTGHQSEAAYMQQLNDMARASAQGRGEFWGNLIGTVGNLAGAFLNPVGGIGSLLGAFTGNKSNPAALGSSMTQAAAGVGSLLNLPRGTQQIPMPSQLPARWFGSPQLGIDVNRFGFPAGEAGTHYGNTLYNWSNYGGIPFYQYFGAPQGAASANFMIGNRPYNVISNTVGGN